MDELRTGQVCRLDYEGQSQIGIVFAHYGNELAEVILPFAPYTPDERPVKLSIPKMMGKWDRNAMFYDGNIVHSKLIPEVAIFNEPKLGATKLLGQIKVGSFKHLLMPSGLNIQWDRRPDENILSLGWIEPRPVIIDKVEKRLPGIATRQDQFSKLLAGDCHPYTCRITVNDRPIEQSEIRKMVFKLSGFDLGEYEEATAKEASGTRKQVMYRDVLRAECDRIIAEHEKNERQEATKLLKSKLMKKKVVAARSDDELPW